MATDFAIVNFSKPASPTNTYTITSLSFAPKAVRFLITKETSLDTMDSHMVVGAGIADSHGNEFAVAVSSKDNVNPSKARRAHALKAILLTDEDGTIIVRANISAWNSNGVTINFSTNDANGYRIRAAFWGGSSIEDWEVKVWQLITAGGPQSVPMSFVPTCSPVLLSTGDSTAPETSGVGHAMMMIGMQGAAGTTEAKCTSWCSDNAVAISNVASTIKTNRSISLIVVKSGTMSDGGQAYISQYLSSGGFEVTYTTYPPNAGYIGGLFLNGSRCVCKHEATPTTSGNKTYTGYGGTPVGLLALGSICLDSEKDVLVNSGYLSAGATAGSGLNGAIAYSDDDNFTPTNSSMRVTGTYHWLLEPSAGNACSLVSFASDQFTVSFIAADSNVRPICFGAIEDGAANAPPRRSLVVPHPTRRLAGMFGG